MVNITQCDDHRQAKRMSAWGLKRSSVLGIGNKVDARSERRSRVDGF